VSLLILLSGMVVLVLIQGFFSGSEIAIVNCDRAKLRHRARLGDSGAKLALRLLEKPEIVLCTTLVGTNIALVTMTTLTTAIIISLVGSQGDLIAVLLLIPFTLIVGEIVPKSAFQQRADEWTPRIIYPLYACSLLLFPVIFFFSRTARLITRFVGSSKGKNLFVAREQVRAILDTSEGGATIDVFDAERIRNVVRFGEYVAGDIMLPAHEMIAVDLETGLDNLTGILRESGQEHIPVYEGERSNIVGIISISIWDLLQPGFQQRDLSDFVQSAYFVPAQHPLVELLPILRLRQDQSAIVVDEYGSAVGMVSVDNVLETVVGSISAGTAFERHANNTKPGWEQIEDEIWRMDARLSIADVNDILGTKISIMEARTIGGHVIARLKHMPSPGEWIEESGYRFSVEETTEKSILKIVAAPVQK